MNFVAESPWVTPPKPFNDQGELVLEKFYEELSIGIPWHLVHGPVSVNIEVTKFERSLTFL